MVGRAAPFGGVAPSRQYAGLSCVDGTLTHAWDSGREVLRMPALRQRQQQQQEGDLR